MKILLLFGVVTFATAFPVNQLFDPFADFLQGSLIKDYTPSGPNISHYNEFASLLENKEYVKNVFNQFTNRFRKQYSNKNESLIRQKILKETLLNIFLHNVQASNGQQSYTMGINQFSDMTPEEIISSYTGYWPSENTKNNNVSHKVVDKEISYADSFVVDPYRPKMVTPVQNQGSCGACVYFAAAAVIESSWAKRGHPLKVLSPQQLNDCANNPTRGNRGCQHGGGTFVPTFDYIKAHGLTTMQNYPYIAKDAPCNKQKESQVYAKISSWSPVSPHGNEEALLKAFNKYGPIAVAIHVNQNWVSYKKGIYDDNNCKGGRNHAVVVVGYGRDAASNKDYWIVKNQWGENFGERGYIRMRRNNNNMCDIAGDAVSVS